MRAFFTDLSGRMLNWFAALILVVSFIPVLYKIVLPLAALIMLVGGGILYLYQRRKRRDGDDSGPWIFPPRLLLSKEAYRRHYKPKTLERRAFRAFRMGLAATLINILLSMILGLHAWWYIRDLKQELEPYKRIFQVITLEDAEQKDSKKPADSKDADKSDAK